MKFLSIIFATIISLITNHQAYGTDLNDLDDNPFSNVKPKYQTSSLEKLFSKVTFNPPMVEVKNCTIYKTSGDLMVHFSDISQIQQSLDNLVSFKASGDIFYIQDQAPGSPLKYLSNKPLECVSAVYVNGIKGYKITGDLTVPQTLIFDNKPDLQNLNLSCNQLLTSVHHKKERHRLIKLFKNFDEHLLSIRTKDAENLMQDIDNKKTDITFKETFDEMHSDAILLSDYPSEFVVDEYVSSAKSLAVVAGSIAQAREFTNKNPILNYFYFVKPSLGATGVYTNKPLVISQIHHISTHGVLVVLGKIKVSRASLKITADKCFMLGINLSVQGDFIDNTRSMSLKGLGMQTLLQIQPELPIDMFLSLLGIYEGLKSSQ